MSRARNTHVYRDLFAETFLDSSGEATPADAKWCTGLQCCEMGFCSVFANVYKCVSTMVRFHLDQY